VRHFLCKQEILVFLSAFVDKTNPKNMKKLCLSSLFIAVTFSAAFSQGVSGGLRLGMNIANESVTPALPNSVESKIGLIAGAYLTIAVSEKF
jgi:hypothetical protein